MRLDTRLSTQRQLYLLRFPLLAPARQEASVRVPFIRGISPETLTRQLRPGASDNLGKGCLRIVASKDSKPSPPGNPGRSPSEPEEAPESGSHGTGPGGKPPTSNTRRRFVSLLCTLFQEFEHEACETSKESE